MTRPTALPAAESLNASARAPAQQIQIVLCGTSHPGNLGAVARAMKNMGLSQLVLVAPTAGIDELALATAKHAADVLHHARFAADLPSALADSVAVWATTARPRELPLPVWTVRAAAECIVADQQTRAGLISLVFGAERTGLSNHELSWAQRVIEIPANPVSGVKSWAGRANFGLRAVYSPAKPTLDGRCRNQDKRPAGRASDPGSMASL